MNRLQPHSVLQLILICFFVALMPLALAVIDAAQLWEKQVRHNRETILELVEMTRSSQALSEYLADMERAARQYNLIEDKVLIDVYEKYHNKFKKALQMLDPTLTSDFHKALLSQLNEQSSALLAAFLADRQNPASLERAIVNFKPMAESTRDLKLEISRRVDEEIVRTRVSANRAQQHLFHLSLLLFPFTIMLIIFLAFLINRPISQLDQAIQSFGRKGFSRPIQISGPKDFRDLGVQLEGLRIRLDDLERQKAQFLRHMSHELKTPLASIKEGIDLLSDQIPGALTEGQQEVVDILLNNSSQLQRLIENLLDYNSITSTASMFVDKISFKNFIHEAVGAYKLIAKNKKLRFQFAGDALEIEADLAKLRATFDNLISNAIDFSPPGGIIKIEWKLKNGELRVWVKDEGPGVAKEDRERIFKPFCQGKNRRVGTLKGSGIGLAIANECIVAHKGKLTVIESQDEGACFQVMMPVTV